MPFRSRPFDATTPRGPVHMINLLAVIPGIPPPEAPSQVPVQRIIVAGHYDTKLFKEFTFVGANDGGSSAALLIELARALKPRTLPMDVELLFLDGEEAVGEWQGSDHTYGSRYYVAGRAEGRDAQDHRRARPGRHDRRQGSADHERGELDALAHRGSVGRRLQARPPRVRRRDDDDRGRSPRVPRGRRPAVDIIDLDYPAWHRADDTLDKLSAASLQSVGDVVVAALGDIAARGRKR